MAPKQAEKPPLPDKTLQQAYNLYFDACERRGLSPGTLRSYRSHWNAHIAPALGKMQLQAITEDVIKGWLQGKRSTSDKKKAESLSTLQRILQAAVEQKWLYENPAKDVHATGGRKKAARRSYPILTHAQLEAIRAAMPPACAIAVDLGAWCALRSGEVCALRRKDIDLVEGVIKVRRAVKQGVRGNGSRGPRKVLQACVTLPCRPRS
ncbi:tyrosine-type recombinase/integrase [Winkia neuii]|nr:site-specific integrase [Winkia neuii]